MPSEKKNTQKLLEKIDRLEKENSCLRNNLSDTGSAGIADFKKMNSEEYDLLSLEKIEDFFHTVYNHAPFMMFGVDDKGNVLFWNRALENSLGWKKEELGKFPDFFKKLLPDKNDMKRVIRDYGSGDKIFREYRAVDKSGNIHIHKWASFHISGNLFAGFGYDITEQKKLESDREDVLAEFETIFNNTSIGIGFLQNGRIFQRINKRGCEIFGYTEDELIGKSVSLVHLSDEAYREFGEKHYNRLVSGDIIHVEQQLKRKNGEIIWCSVFGKAVLPPDLDKGVIWVVDDITSKKEYEKKLYYMAVRDDLTSLYNRRYFFNKADEILGRVRRYEKELTAAIIDIDFFKYINDTYGHQTGDKVLKNTASVIDRCTRETDLLARYGGEEFVLFMEETDIEGAETVLERIKTDVAENNVCDKISITVSAGAASWKKGESVDSLLKRADKALYDAKKKGRNRIEYSS